MNDPMNSDTPHAASSSPLPEQFQSATAPVAAPGDRASAATEDTAQAASSLAGQAKQKLTASLEAQKGSAADVVEQLAQTVKQSGERFEGQQDWIASAVGRAAAELDTLAGSLRDKDLGELARAVQSFAGRRPALFMGAALAAGFAIARLGKVAAGDLSRDDLPTIPKGE